MPFWDTRPGDQRDDAPVFIYDTHARQALSASASTLQAGSPAMNVCNPSTAEQWRAATTGTNTLTVNIPQGIISGVYLAAHNLQSSSITIDCLEADGSRRAKAVNVAISDNSPIMLALPEATATTQWRFIISTGSDRPLPRVGTVGIGRLVKMPRTVWVGHTPVQYARTPRVASGESETGEFLGRIVTSTGLASSLSFQNIEYGFYRSNVAPMVRAIETRPFCLAVQPNSRQFDTALCWAKGGSEPTWQQAGLCSFSIAYGAHQPWS